MKNKVIWMIWLQGEQNAPPLVSTVVRRWREQNPGWDVRVLEQKDVDEICEKTGFRNKSHTPQVQSDFVRTYLLSEYGGVWADATLLPIKPLDDWLPSLVDRSGFFSFASLGDPNIVLGNWFLAADPRCVLMEKWFVAFREYFSLPRKYMSFKNAVRYLRLGDYMRHRSQMKIGATRWFAQKEGGYRCLFYPYAIHNYCLSEVMATNPDVRSVWEATPKRCAHLISFLGSLTRDKDTKPEMLLGMADELLSLAPLHKLSYRTEICARLAEVASGK